MSNYFYIWFKLRIQQIYSFFFFFSFLGPHLRHMEVPRIGVKLELQLLAYAFPDPSGVCNLHHSSQQRWFLNPLSKARVWTSILMDTNQVPYHWATTGTPTSFFYIEYSCFPISFVEKTVLSPWECLGNTVKNNFNIYMSVYFWPFFSILLVYMAILMPGPQCFAYCRFVISFIFQFYWVWLIHITIEVQVVQNNS